MIFINMEMKLLHLYMHNHSVELQTLEHAIQTLLDGPFDHEDFLWEVDI
jgi:hypothetical protein